MMPAMDDSRCMDIGRLAGRMAFLAALALALGLAANAWGPRRLPLGESAAARAARRWEGIARLTVEETRAAVAARSRLILDARPAAEWRAGRIPGAVSLPADDFEREWPALLPLMPEPETPLLVYCREADCDEALTVVRALRARGYRNIAALPDGFHAWRAGGGAVETDP